MAKSLKHKSVQAPAGEILCSQPGCDQKWPSIAQANITKHYSESHPDIDRKEMVVLVMPKDEVESAAMVEAMIKEIEAGWHDGQLRRLSRACFDRAKKAGLTDSKPPEKQERPTVKDLDPPANPAQPVAQATRSGSRRFANRKPREPMPEQNAIPPNLIINSAVAHLTPEEQRNADPNDTFTVAFTGRTYRRSDFLQHYMSIRPGMYTKSQSYNGMYVRIIGCGAKAFMVQFPTVVGAAAFENPDGSSTGFIYYNKCDGIIA